jgi:hypothetical protein
MTEQMGGLVADSLFDEAVPLDGIVGRVDDLVEAPPIGAGVLQVFVSGGAASGSRAVGLAKDLEQLVHEFVRRPDSIDAERTRVPKTPNAGEDEKIQIALHGLALEPDAESELHHLIRGRVLEYLAGGETGQ